ncbi:MAG: type II toxin-antitoxin system HicA family toxin [Bacteroidota bacterium]
MGNFRPIPTKCWERFLQENGFTLTRRAKGSHDQWTKKGFRTIPVWGDEKEIPPQHLKTGCFTIGIIMKDLYEWVNENC